MPPTASGSGERATPPPLSEIEAPALFLDFDGTLVDLAPTPDDIDVPAHLAGALERKAAELDGRLAVVTGRYLGDIRGHLSECAVVFCGSHGAEIEGPDGSPVGEHKAPELPAHVLAKTHEFAAGIDGLVLEEKAFGLGLHYRACPDRGGEIREFAQSLAHEHTLHLRLGKMLAELSTTNSHKGEGVRAIMAQPPFAGATPIFVGDDLTDEDGFDAVVDQGGFGVLVGERRETKARYHLFDVAAVHEWLELE